MNPFAFKGRRDYLHSTTVFDYILGEIGGEPRKIDFKFNKRTDRVCVLTDYKPAQDATPVVTYTDSERTLYMIETGTGISEHVPYDEDDLAKSFHIECRMIHIPAGVRSNSFIECVVAAYKRLLLDLHGKHRFAFARICLEHIPQAAFTVEYTRKLSGGFYQGAISENGRAIGRIFFGEWI